MKTTNMAKALINSRYYYGWMIVFVASVGVLFSGPGQTYSISLFINAYIEQFGWSRSMVSGFYSVATVLSGSLLFFVGRLIDRYGSKHMAIAVGTLLGLACLWNSFIIGPVMLFIGFFTLRLFGQGSMTMVPNTLVPQWFVKKRGFAMSMMAIGGVVGSAVIPPFNTWMITNFGWPFAWRMWALLLWFFFVPLAAIFIYNKPDDVGLFPDSNGSTREQESTTGAEKSDDFESWTLKQAMRTRSFWLMLFCQAIPSMIGTGIIFHLVSILGEKGLSITVTSLVLSTIAVVAFPATLIAGRVVDRFSVHKVTAFSFVWYLATLFVLMIGQSAFAAFVFAVMNGLYAGFNVIIVGILWPNYFGRKYLGSIRGMAQMFLVYGSALGPLPFGLAYDWFGGYTEILWIMMIFPIVGLFAALAAPKPHRPSAEPANDVYATRER